MPFYFIRIEDDANTGIPMGYEFGVIDEFNAAPQGSKVAATQDILDQLIAAAEKADTKVDPVVVEEMPPEECPVQIPEGVRWFVPVVTAAIDPSLSQRDQAHLSKCIKVHQKWVAENSSLRYEIISDYNRALHKITKSNLDGPNGVLAQNESRINQRTQEIVSTLTRFDAADGLNHATGLHEFCHGDGLPHQTVDPNGLMFPSKNNAAYYGSNEQAEYKTKYPIAKVV